MCEGSSAAKGRIIVDADACPRPVLEIAGRLARKRGWDIITVASFNHSIRSKCHVTVDDGPEAVDLRILNMCGAGDVVISQDWGLAAMVLAKGAYCLSPSGREYRHENMDAMLEIREAMAKHRRGGGKTKGPKKRSPADDARFEGALDALLK